MSDDNRSRVGRFPFKFWVFGVPTTIIGWAIHGSIFWSIMDLIFWPFAWIKWLIFEEVTIEIITHAFDFLSA